MAQNIFEKIKNIEDLPTLPSVSMDVIRLAQSSDISINQISERIYTDPPLATKVLKMANSAYYRRGSRQIDTLHRALVLMGLSEIISIITSVSALSILPPKNSESASIRNSFWEHCVATGLIAKYIDKKLCMQNKGKEFVGGLLHDIGKIILDEYCHDEFIQSHEMSKKTGCPIYEAEMELLGTNHMEIGHFLMSRWNLPSYLADINLWHHDPSNAESKEITALISLSDILAKSSILSFGDQNSCYVLKDEDSWNILKGLGYPMDDLDLEKMTFEIEDMSAEVKTYIASITEDDKGAGKSE